MHAVVFDFDGVIMQSMEAHAKAYQQVMAELEIHIQPRDIYVREGARSETIIADLLREADRPRDQEVLDELVRKKEEIFRSLGRQRLYRGAQALVQAAWTAGVRTGVVTGTRRSNLERLIPEMAPRFNVLLTQEDYDRDKPHPEPYQRALAALDVAAADCLVIENAIRGVESARAAGCHVWAITTTLHADDLGDAHRVFADHKQTRLALEEALA